MKNPFKSILYLFDSLLGGYFGQYLEVRSLEFFLAWGEATKRPFIGPYLKRLFVWFCKYFTGIVVPSLDSLEGRPKILPSEDVINLVKRARVTSLHPCTCKAHIIPDDPSIPRDTCMGFTFVEGMEDLSDESYHADFKLRQEIIDKLRQCEELGLVHQIMTTSKPTGKKGYVLCNCDGQSCIPVILFRKYGIPMVRTSGYLLNISDIEKCTACGICVKRCIFDAATLSDKKPVTDLDKCMGCGVCVKTCKAEIRSLAGQGSR
jgi:ferredoxin